MKRIVQTLFDKKKEKKMKQREETETETEKDIDSREVELESPHDGSPPLPLNDSKDSTVMMVSNLPSDKLPMFVDSRPLCFGWARQEGVVHIAGLRDGSFITCSSDFTAKRWVIATDDTSHNKFSLKLAGTFVGHKGRVLCAVQKDDDTIITTSNGYELKEWQLSTCRCIKSVIRNSSASASFMMKTRDGSRIVCGLVNGDVEFIRMSDLSLVSSFNVGSFQLEVECICELNDGTFVSPHDSVKKWNESGSVLNSFAGGIQCVHRMIEL